MIILRPRLYYENEPLKLIKRKCDKARPDPFYPLTPFTLVDLRPIVELVTVKAELFTPGRLPEPVCADPDDDKFLACALASKSKVIVSGDKHLLNSSGFRGIKVLRPREFVDTYLCETCR